MKIRRTAAVLLSVLLTLSLLPAVIFAANGEIAFGVKAGAEKLQPGDTVTVYLSIDKTSAFYQAGCVLKYDTAALEYISNTAVTVTLMKTAVVQEDGAVYVTLSANNLTDSSSYTGNIAEIVFKVREGFTGSTKLTAEVKSAVEGIGGSFAVISNRRGGEALLTVEEAAAKSAVSLKNTSVETAWGLDFTTEITASQTDGEGADVTLAYDTGVVKLKSSTPAAGTTVTADEASGLIKISHPAKLSASEKLVSLVFTTSEELASGSYSYLSLRSGDTVNKSDFTGFTIYETGDVNTDGKVNSRDVTLIKQASVKLITLTDVQKAYADAYPDGNVNSRDATIITQYVVHMDVTLGDRVSVTFTDARQGASGTVTVNRSVHKGNTLTAPPAAPEGYAWSAKSDSYSAPDYTNITKNMTFYLVKKDA